MSTNKNTASKIFSSFRGSTPAYESVYHKVLANRHSAAPSIFSERKPAVFSPAMIYTDTPRVEANATDKLLAQMLPKVPNYLESALKCFESPQAALDAAMAMKAGFGTGTKLKTAKAYLESRGLRPVNIATVGSPTGGGFLQPDAMAQGIIAKRGRVGVARQLARVVPVVSGQTSMPIETGGLSVFYASETASLTESDFTFANLVIYVDSRTVFTKWSNNLGDDAMVVMVDHFGNSGAYVLAKTEDAEFINGDGSAAFGGVTGLLHSLGSAGVSAAAAGHDTLPEIDIDDLAAGMGLLNEDFANGNESWLVHPKVYVTAMLAAVGGASQGFDENGRPLFLGKPVFFSSEMPSTIAASTVYALYGSFSEACVIGDAGIRFATSDKTSDAFQMDATFAKAVADYDIQVHNGGSASAVGAYVGLSTAS